MPARSRPVRPDSRSDSRPWPIRVVAGLVVLAGVGLPVAGARASTPTEPGDDPVERSVPTGSSVVPPAEIEVLGAGLLSAAEVGVPDTWDIVDVDPEADDDLRDDPTLDAYQSLLACQDRIEPAAVDGPWIWRTFRAPDDAPALADGTVAVSVAVALEDDDDFDDRIAGLTDEDCEAAPTATVELGTIEVRVSPVAAVPEQPGDTLSTIDVEDTVDATTVDLRHEPTAEVAYPAAVTTVVAHRDGLTVTVTVRGLDQAAEWGPYAANIAGRVLWNLAYRAS